MSHEGAGVPMGTMKKQAKAWVRDDGCGVCSKGGLKVGHTLRDICARIYKLVTFLISVTKYLARKSLE